MFIIVLIFRIYLQICANYFLLLLKKESTLISDITRMDQIDGLSEDYLTVIVAYTATTVIVAYYIIFDWGDERISREPNLVRILLCEVHMH